MSALSAPEPRDRRVLWVNRHSRERWQARVGCRELPSADDMLARWHEAEPVDVPWVQPPSYCRAHEPTWTLLVARWGLLRTVTGLRDRSLEEQRHVREQLEEDPRS